MPFQPSRTIPDSLFDTSLRHPQVSIRSVVCSGWREDEIPKFVRGYDPNTAAWKEIQGRSYFLGAPDTGSLKVSFFWPFFGAYSIMALDPDYRWAIVVGPSHGYLWILARSPTLPDQVFEPLVDQARDADFDLIGLIRVKHGRARIPQSQWRRRQP